MARVADIILIMFNGSVVMYDKAIEIIEVVRTQGLPFVLALAVGESK